MVKRLIQKLLLLQNLRQRQKLLLSRRLPQKLRLKSLQRSLLQKAPAKKTATKANAPANAAEKKTPVKSKTAAKLSDPKETVKVQFGGEEFDFANIKKAVEADYKSKFKGKVKTIEIYIKPEDKAAYYVINGDFSDKVEL